MNSELASYSSEFRERCIGCNLCVMDCRLLQQINEEPLRIAERGPSAFEAYSCFLCGLCETVCPAEISVKKLFALTRERAVNNAELDISEYRYMFPDRRYTTMSFYRELSGIDYKDLSVNERRPVAFLPGCTMLTFAEGLTRSVYRHLLELYPTLTIVPDCCGLPLFQLGLKERGEKFINTLKAKLNELEISTLVIACPNCYYQLRRHLSDSGIKLVTIYEALAESEVFRAPASDEKPVITIHDSCPDRFEEIYATQARGALVHKGYRLREMKHHRMLSLCCGSGGQVSHFQPELGQEVVEIRMQEAKATTAGVLAGYCVGCVLNLAKAPGKMKVTHVLNILLDLEQDYTEIKEKSKAIYQGPDGMEYWARIMEEP